jgi:prephenate dehydrogenase
VGIVGLGLLGGSVARDLRRLPERPLVRALSRDSRELEAARAEGVVDEVAEDAVSFCAGLDLAVYCTPLNATLELLTAHSPHLREGVVVTDVASLKTPLRDRTEALGLAEAFVGSHPMAGGEGSGFHASREGLFEGARIWLVSEGARPEVATRIRSFWHALGGQPSFIDAGEHDVLMARVSHLPQLTATALALVLESNDLGRHDLGPGGRDMTRLAGSGPTMWRDLLEHAPTALPEALEALENHLARLRAFLREGRADAVEDLMKQTRAWSRREPWS